MDKLVDHMFIFQGDGVIQDFNGTYSQWKAQPKEIRERQHAMPAESKSDTKDSTPIEVAINTPADKRKLSYKEKMEMQSIDKRLDEIEKRKKEIGNLFMDTSLDNEKIQALSIESGLITSEAEEIETRWLELAEYA
jgi:ATP-binding cassette subfamily F protein uup